MKTKLQLADELAEAVREALPAVSNSRRCSRWKCNLINTVIAYQNKPQELIYDPVTLAERADIIPITVYALDSLLAEVKRLQAEVSPELRSYIQSISPVTDEMSRRVEEANISLVKLAAKTVKSRPNTKQNRKSDKKTDRKHADWLAE